MTTPAGNPSSARVDDIGGLRRRNKGGRPPRIDRDAVVRAGLEIGLEGLTLRAVGESLGVSTQALYNYVRDRDELIALVGEAVLESHHHSPDDGRPWTEWIYDSALELKALLESAPGFSNVAISRGHAMPTLLEIYETQLRVAMRDGFDATTAMWATRSVNEMVQSWVSRQELQSAAARESGVGYWDDVRSVIDADADRFPLVAEALDTPRALDGDLRFRFTLTRLIDGIGQVRQA